MVNLLLKKDLILTNIEENLKTKKDAINFISEKCSNYNIDKKILEDAFISRENISSTGFGGGIAIPHAKIKDVKNPLIGIFKFKNGIDWDAIDDEPVQIAIALVMPDGDNTHLDILSKFSRKLMNEKFTQFLFEANNVENIYKFILDEVR